MYKFTECNENTDTFYLNIEKSLKSVILNLYRNIPIFTCKYIPKYTYMCAHKHTYKYVYTVNEYIFIRIHTLCGFT